MVICGANGECRFDHTHKLYRLVFFKNEPDLQTHLAEYHDFSLEKLDDEPWPELYWLPSSKSASFTSEKTLSDVQNLDGKWNQIVYSGGLALLNGEWQDEFMTASEALEPKSSEILVSA